MLIPSLLYGKFAEVKSAVSKAVTRLKRGTSWEDAMDARSVVNTAALPGLVVLHGPSGLLGDSPHFQVFAPLSKVMKEISEGHMPQSVAEEIFTCCLQTSWGFLGLVAQSNNRWLFPPHRHVPFWKATLQYWDELVAVGDRYTFGQDIGKSLWDTPNNIHYVLGNLGIPQEQLRALPRGGIRAFSARLKLPS